MSALKGLDRLAEGGSEEKWEAPEIPERPIRIKGRGPDAGKEWNGWMRIFSAEEELERDRRLASWLGGFAVESMPNYGYWSAMAVIRTMWRDGLPAWMEWNLVHNKAFAFAIATEVEKFEADFRKDYVDQGATNPAEAGFSVTSGDDVPAGDPVGSPG